MKYNFYMILDLLNNLKDFFSNFYLWIFINKFFMNRIM